MKQTVILMGPERIKRAVIRMAYQIYEVCHGSRDIVLIGINKRGYITACKLAEELKNIIKSDVPVINILADQSELIDNSEINLQDKYVIVVDDVIFSGRTFHQTIQKISRFGEPKRLMSAVLVDRGHRRYPIEVQFVGLESPTKLNEHVSVNFSTKKEITEVVLEIS